MSSHRTLNIYVEGAETVDFSKVSESDPLLERLRMLALDRVSSEFLVLRPTPEITAIMFRLGSVQGKPRPNKTNQALLMHAWKTVWSFKSLTPAARTGFQAAEITYVWELVQFNEYELNVHQVGPGRRQMLARDLADLGLRFGMMSQVERNRDAIMAAKPQDIVWPVPPR